MTDDKGNDFSQLINAFSSCWQPPQVITHMQSSSLGSMADRRRAISWLVYTSQIASRYNICPYWHSEQKVYVPEAVAIVLAEAHYRHRQTRNKMRFGGADNAKTGTFQNRFWAGDFLAMLE